MENGDDWLLQRINEIKPIEPGKRTINLYFEEYDCRHVVILDQGLDDVFDSFYVSDQLISLGLLKRLEITSGNPNKHINVCDYDDKPRMSRRLTRDSFK